MFVVMVNIDSDTSAFGTAIQFMGQIFDGIISVLDSYPVFYVFLLTPVFLGILYFLFVILTDSANDQFQNKSIKSGVAYFGRIGWKNHLDNVKEKKRLQERMEREVKRREDKLERERINMARAVFNRDERLESVEINGHIYSRDRVQVRKVRHSRKKFGKLFTVQNEDDE